MTGRQVRIAGSSVLVAFAAVIGWYSLTHAMAPQEPIVGRALGVLAVGGIAVPLGLGGVWIVLSGDALDGRTVCRVLGWCVGGAVPLTTVSLLVIGFQREHGVTLAEPAGVLLWIAGGGAVGGLITGIHDVRRRRAYRSQRATTDRLRGLIDAAPVPIIEHEPDGTVRRWNDAAERVFGWSAAETVGDTLPFLSASNRTEYEQLRDRMADGERLEAVEISRETKAGEARDLLLSTAPVWNEDRDTLESIIGVLVDVSERRERRERLELFQLLLDHSNDSIFLVDAATGDFVDVNETACQMLGYDRATLLDQSVTDVEVSLSTDADWQAHVERVESAGSVMFEGEHRRADGSTYPVEVNIAHAELDGHDRTYMVAIARDITDRLERERTLKRYERAVEQAGHAIYITDTDGTIQYANPAFEEITGYDPNAVIGEDPSILRSGEHDADYYRRLWETILGGDVWEETKINRRKSGERYTARQTIAPIFDDDTIIGFVAIQSDVTDERVREQRLDVLDRILRHNHRNALNVISGHAEQLCAELDEAHRPTVETIRDRALELGGLSEKARDVKRSLARTRPPSQPVPVADLLGRVGTEYEDRHPDATVEVTAATTAAVPASLRPALAELVENAITHADTSQPAVRLEGTLATDGEQVSIAVRDDGPSIPSRETVPLRGTAETPLQHGSGLGLWLVRWVTTALGGTVDVAESTAGGNAVTITVPRLEDGTDPADGSPAGHSTESGPDGIPLDTDD